MLVPIVLDVGRGVRGHFSRLVHTVVFSEIKEELERDRKQIELDIATRVSEVRNEARALELMAEEDKLSTQRRIHSTDATTTSVAVEPSQLRSIHKSSGKDPLTDYFEALFGFALEPEVHVSSLSEQALPGVDSFGGGHGGVGGL